MKKQILQTDYTKFRQPKQLVLPLNVEYLIPKDESVRLLDQVMEELDYSQLNLTYSAQGRKPAVRPETFAKIIIYAYSRGIYSTRQIESSCKFDVRFQYLLQQQKAPDHNTIARFISDHLGPCLEDLLEQFVRQLMSVGEITPEQIFVDGTKIEANANKYTFVWKGAIEKNMEKLRKKAAKYLWDELGMAFTAEQIDARVLKRAWNHVRNRVEKEGIIFVLGVGHRKTPQQRQYETLEEWSGRMSSYEESLRIMGKDRNSCSKTDPDATFMHMKEDHMRNSQLKPGYNVQAATNSEYILGIYVSADRTDSNTLIPFLEKLGRSYGEGFLKRVVADAGYESEENYDYLKQKQIRPFIKPSNHEYSKTPKFQRDMEFRLAMEYDAQEDSYTCKGGRKLLYCYTRHRESGRGYKSETKVYRCQDCSGCPYLGKCYKGKYAKQIQVSEKFDAYRAQSEANISSEEGILLRINRSIQAEGVFGITKQDMEYDRFLRRGMRGVTIEYLLLAFGFNVNKLHCRIQGGRIGTHLLGDIKEAKTA